MSADVIRASSLQHGVWVTERARPVGSAYVMPLVVWFDGPLAVPALLDACAAVVARHELLRSVPVEGADGLVLAPSELSPLITYVDRTDDTATSPAQAVVRHVEVECAAAFDLSRGPLCRFTVLTFAPHVHALIVVVHHLCFDGMSKDVLVDDLAAAYSPLAAGLGPPATRPSRVAKVLERHERRVEQLRDEAARFWAERWSAAAVPVLPGLDRIPEGGEPGAALPVDLTALSAPIAATASELGVSRFEFLVAGLQALYHRYGNESFAIAVDLSTRMPGAPEDVGLFVNELPIFGAPTPHLPFSALALAVRAEMRRLNTYRCVPLSRAGVGLAPHTALSPLSFSYRARTVDPKFEGLDCTVDWMVHNGSARNTLHVQVVDAAPELTMNLQYPVAALSRADVEAIAGHLGTLLRGAATDPATRIGDLPLLPVEEQRAVVEAGTAEAVPYDLDQTVVSLFRRQAAATPAARAVVCRGRSLDYAELDELTDRAAHRLRAAGVREGTVVGVRLDRSLGLLVTVLGIMKARGAYLPLDPAYPPDRIAFVLADSLAPVVVSATAEDQAPPATRVIAYDELVEIPHPRTGGAATADVAAALPEPAPSDLAYVIYTSGSTGRPKGVEIEHRPLTNLLHAFGDLVGAGQDTWLAHTSLSFDICALELFSPLVAGGCVVLATDDQVRDGQALVELVRAEGVSQVQATPAGWRMLLAGGFHQPGVVALVGGEALPAPLARELRPHVARLVNCYGPTEATVWCTVADLTDDRRAVTIGRPIANTTAYVLDERRRPVPIGVPGELHIGGVGLARGYRGRPELTAERFIPDPFAGPDPFVGADPFAGPDPFVGADPSGPDRLAGGGARLYRTGDTAVLLRTGELRCLGRRDNQVKLRGHRIELGEIEAAVVEDPAVEQAAVIVHGDDVDARLVAYLVPRGDVDTRAIREHLTSLLPDYMVPTAYVVLDAMPLTPNGKIDRAALPEPQRRTAAAALDALAVEEGPVDDAVTSVVRQIFCDVLRLDTVGLDDDLFDLGGHSLSITQIIARLRSTLDVDVPLHVFFDDPTVSGVVAAIPGPLGTAAE